MEKHKSNIYLQNGQIKVNTSWNTDINTTEVYWRAALRKYQDE